MSSETLRRAAALMRERAEAATAGPWELDSNECCIGASGRTGEHYWVLGERTGAPVQNQRHAASWHPAVALAVADWLDAEASNRDAGIGGRGWFSVGGQSDALAVARAYLGEPS